MKRITLAMSILTLAAAAARAQDTVVRARPTPAPAPRPAIAPDAPLAPTPRPALAPMEPMEPMEPMPPMLPRALRAGQGIGIGVSPFDVNVNIDADAMREQARAMAEDARIQAENMRIDTDMMREQARAMADDARIQALDHMDLAFAQPFPMAAPTPFPSFSFSVGPDRFNTARPPAAWAQGDPADSLYRIARETMNNGDYRRAAQLFSDITQKYPKSEYMTYAVYYQAYARYRLGSTEELKAAAKALEPLLANATTSTDNCSSSSFATAVTVRAMAGQNGQYPVAPTPRAMTRRCGNSDMDVSGLYTRINGVLAERGDRDAAAKVAEEAKKTGGTTCDQEDQRVRVEALNALVQMDPNSAMPIIKKVLDRKDECSAELRKQAVFMLGRRGDAESSTLLISLAKSDPNVDVRATAIQWLPRVPGDAAYAALEEVLRTDTDERVQRAAVQALMSSDNPKARLSMRALIERNDAPIQLRVEAINSFNKDRGSPEDAAYLRGLYAKVDNDRLKQAVINAVARMNDPDSDQWLLALARNQNEPSQYRSIAVSRLTRSTVPIADLNKLYDAADSRSLRDQVISALGNRKEPEATDKLIDIVKNSTTDIQLREHAIQTLTRKNDPRSQAALLEILDRKP